MNEYFSDNYGEARDKFLAKCEQVGFRQMRFRVPAEESPELFIDFALLKRDPKKCLIHISGVHGIEGYAGSAVQNAILDHKFSEDGASILFIHALNPYGMAFYRRANAQNVDLNRNCLKNRDPSQNTDYLFFDSYLNPSSFWGFYTGALKAYYQYKRLGKARSSQAIASGQTLKSGGLFFAGDSIQREIKLVQEFLYSHLKEIETSFVIDLHTGLGNYCQELLFIDQDKENSSISLFEKTFHRKINHPNPENGIYENRGPLSDGIRAALPKTKVHYCLQEFGTRPEKNTFAALRLENYEWKKRVLQNYPKRSIVQQMLNTFCPPEAEWRNNLLELGKSRFFQALSTLEQC